MTVFPEQSNEGASESFLTLAAFEWRNLLALGRIRVMRSRVVSGQLRSDRRLQRLLFVRTPHGNLTDSANFRIVELSTHWCEHVQSHPEDPEGKTVFISMDMVAKTFPSMEKDRHLLELDASRVGVAVSGAEFEAAWEEWMVEEGIQLGLFAGRGFASLLGVLDEGGDLTFPSEPTVRVVLHRPTDVQNEILDVLRRFFELRRDIQHGIAEHRGSGAFPLVCVYEWIHEATGIDMLAEGQALADELQRSFDLLRKQSAGRQGWSSNMTGNLLDKIRDAFPQCFPEPLAPLFFPLLLSYSEDLELERFDLHVWRREFAAWANAEGLATAQLLAFILGVEIELERVRELSFRTRLTEAATPPESSGTEDSPQIATTAANDATAQVPSPESQHSSSFSSDKEGDSPEPLVTAVKPRRRAKPAAKGSLPS